MNRKRLAIRSIAAALALILCMSTAVFAEPATGISLSTPKEMTYQGETQTITATVTPDEAGVTWSSSDTSVATVDDKGVVTAQKSGKTTITAAETEGSASASVEVKVTFKSGLQNEGGKIVYYDGNTGKKDETHTSIDKYTAGDNGWYYINGGTFDKSFTGFAQNENGWWYVEKGRVTFKKNDVIQGKVNGKTAWWNVRKSKVTAGPTVAKNNKGWWYIDSEGKVNFKYNGLAKNKNGWWYCKKGKVNFKYNGLAKNSNGTWRVAKGKVTFGFTGVAKYGKKSYYIKKGKVQYGYSGKVKYKGATYQVKKGIATESTKAAMVTKAQGYSSSTRWLVLVDRKHHKLAAFSGSKGNWTLRRYYSIADGKATPNGQFSMGTRFSYYDSAAGNRCWYCITIKGYYLFHSVLCDPRSSTPKVKNGTVGKTISKGCIRQPVKDAKWLYDTCPRGTKIVIYK